MQQLIRQAKERIIIIPGGGVRSNHIKELKDYTLATELHSAAITNTNSDSIDIDEIEKLLIAIK